MDAPFPQPVLGRLIRRLRRERDLSQDALARVAGVGAKYLGEIERGACSPTITTVYKVAGGLRLRAGELIRLVDEQLDADAAS